MSRETQPVEVADGFERHPAFGMIGASRVQVSRPGATLFDSEIQHGQTIRLRVQRARRKRKLNSDWIHGESRHLIEVEMSEAQWASFVSSMNTGGVPCTIRQTESDISVPELPYEPRMAHAVAETTGAADRAFAAIREALAAYEEHKTVGNLRALRAAIENATPNVKFATETLAEHVEGVVTRARADIEALANRHAEQGEIAAQTAARMTAPLELQ